MGREGSCRPKGVAGSVDLVQKGDVSENTGSRLRICDRPGRSRILVTTRRGPAVVKWGPKSLG